MNNRYLLENLYKIYEDFKNTSLYIENSKNIVFGEGNESSKIIFIGEAPGEEEDLQARPFVGRSGRLLTAGIEASGNQRKDFFITNIVKCRPPNNRKPTHIEIEAGKRLILNHEINIIKPKIIVTLGATALNGLLNKDYKITSVKGKIIDSPYGKIFPIYHPSYILRNFTLKDEFFNDIKTAISLSKEL